MLFPKIIIPKKHGSNHPFWLLVFIHSCRWGGSALWKWLPGRISQPPTNLRRNPAKQFAIACAEGNVPGPMLTFWQPCWPWLGGKHGPSRYAFFSPCSRGVQFWELLKIWDLPKLAWSRIPPWYVMHCAMYGCCIKHELAIQDNAWGIQDILALRKAYPFEGFPIQPSD